MDKSQWYLCFTLSHDEDEAAEIYEKKFGAPPEVIEEEKLLIWLGPVPSVRAGGVEGEKIRHEEAVGEGLKPVASGDGHG